MKKHMFFLLPLILCGCEAAKTSSNPDPINPIEPVNLDPDTKPDQEPEPGQKDKYADYGVFLGNVRESSVIQLPSSSQFLTLIFRVL